MLIWSALERGLLSVLPVSILLITFIKLDINVDNGRRLGFIERFCSAWHISELWWSPHDLNNVSSLRIMAESLHHYDLLIFISFSCNFYILVKLLFYAFALGLALDWRLSLLFPNVFSWRHGARSYLVLVIFIRNTSATDVSKRFLGSLRCP